MIDEHTRRALATALAAGPPLRLAIVFGSVARGTARPDSDLDVAILPTAGELALAQEGALVSALEDASGRAVDLVVLDRAPAALVWRVARDGVCLLSSPASEFPSWRARVAIEHADWVEVSSAAMEGFRARLAARSVAEAQGSDTDQ